jgi:glucose-6-phosphate isomerase
LTISLAIGFDNFDELLGGANEMDDHFKRLILIRICRLFCSCAYGTIIFWGGERSVDSLYAISSKLAPYLQQGQWRVMVKCG